LVSMKKRRINRISVKFRCGQACADQRAGAGLAAGGSRKITISPGFA
jgi:hypothetical protein